MYFLASSLLVVIKYNNVVRVFAIHRLSSRVLCATLAIPIPPSHSKIDQMLGQDETTIEKQRRLSTLLGLPNPPDRASLVKDLVSNQHHYYNIDLMFISF